MTSWTAACKASLSFTISWSLLKFMSIELVMPFNHLILCRPLLLLPSIFLDIRVFSSKLAFHIRWPKYWSFSFSISPSNGYSGLSSFRIDWFDLLTVQGTLKSFLQHHNSKAAMKLKDARSLKKNYDQTRQHIKKQRYYFANKGLSCQSFGFSSSHVWM